MRRLFVTTVLALFATTATAGPRHTLEGRWKNPKGSVIVDVAPCGDALCGTVSWASAHNREKGTAPGIRVLSDLRPDGDGSYKGRAFEPKRNIRGSAIVTQEGANVMVVKGCAMWSLLCKEQRWTRVG